MSKSAIGYLVGVCVVFAIIVLILTWTGQYSFWSWWAGCVFGSCWGAILQFERMKGRL